MDDFFEDQQGETVFQNQDYSSSQQYESQNHEQVAQDNGDDEFDFAQPAQNQNQFSQQYSAFQQEDQATKRIREEEQRIQQRLREKANQEYQEKQKRKEAGRKILEEFLQKKEQEKVDRHQQNIEKQTRAREQNKKLNETAGWKKVAANVPLKQGEHTGKKDITRMRQSIINKRSDE